MDCVKLDILMTNKKKGEASKNIKDEFYYEITNLFKEEGYTNRAEAYLFGGLSYMGVKPFGDYILNEENRMSIYSKLINGEKFYNAKYRTISFKLELHLLAFCLNRMPEEFQIMGDIIRKLPGLSLSKNGIVTNDLLKILEKYFISELEPEAELPNLNELILKQTAKEKFINLMSVGLASFTPKNQKEEVIFKKIHGWITEANTQTEQGKNMANMAEITSKVLENDKNPTTYQGELTWKDGIALIENQIRKYEIQLDQSVRQKDQLEQDLSCVQKRVETMLAEKIILERRISENHEIISSLRSKQNSLENQLTIYQSVIENKDREIEERKRYVDIISRDLEKKIDEMLNRIAAKLKVEYKDFLEANNMEMTINLGENMRFQLETIFNILSQNGIRIKQGDSNK